MVQPVRVGIIGAGFSADLHMDAYRRCKDLDVDVVAVAATTQAHAEAFARRHGIPHACAGGEALIAREDINVVDLCVPTRWHEPFAVAAARAGKHVI